MAATTRRWNTSTLQPRLIGTMRLTIDVLLREGKQKKRCKSGNPGVRAWTSYDMLLACAAHKPPAEIATLASRIEPEDDPETNYFAASHLAYCGQNRGRARHAENALCRPTTVPILRWIRIPCSPASAPCPNMHRFARRAWRARIISSPNEPDSISALRLKRSIGINLDLPRRQRRQVRNAAGRAISHESTRPRSAGARSFHLRT